MSFKIAVSGKGGVGKTTVAGLLITRLISRGCKPVLAVDADPNTCLDAVLGVKAIHTIGSVREEAKEAAAKGLSVGISKQQLLELKISESLIEANNFDLIAMGRPEGPGCYCYANNVLKQALGEISSQYPYIVLDNEAGLENLSRRIVTRVDVLVIVADPSVRGLETVERLWSLAKEMDIGYGKLAIIVNRLRQNELPPLVADLKTKTGADFVFGLGDDEEIARFAQNGRTMFELPADNPVVAKLDNFIMEISSLWQKNQ